jgi:hypothetical protein
MSFVGRHCKSITQIMVPRQKEPIAFWDSRSSRAPEAFTDYIQ